MAEFRGPQQLNCLRLTFDVFSGDEQPARVRVQVLEGLSALCSESGKQESHQGRSGSADLLADRLQPGGATEADQEGKRSRNLLCRSPGHSSEQLADQGRGLWHS